MFDKLMLQSWRKKKLKYEFWSIAFIKSFPNHGDCYQFRVKCQQINCQSFRNKKFQLPRLEEFLIKADYRLTLGVKKISEL